MLLDQLHGHSCFERRCRSSSPRRVRAVLAEVEARHLEQSFECVPACTVGVLASIEFVEQVGGILSHRCHTHVHLVPHHDIEWPVIRRGLHELCHPLRTPLLRRLVLDTQRTLATLCHHAHAIHMQRDHLALPQKRRHHEQHHTILLDVFIDTTINHRADFDNDVRRL